MDWFTPEAQQLAADTDGKTVDAEAGDMLADGWHAYRTDRVVVLTVVEGFRGARKARSAKAAQELLDGLDGVAVRETLAASV